MSTPQTLDAEHVNKVKKKAKELLPGLREKLGSSANDVTDEVLLKFLHWKPDIKRAAERFEAHIKWRKNNPFFFDRDPPLTPAKDPVLKRVLESEVIVAPEGMVDKSGNAVIVGRLRNNDMEDGRTPEDVVRMFVYTIDRMLEDEKTQINGVTVFHDLNGLARKNVHPAIPKMLIPALVGNLPIRIQGIYIMDAPLFFRALFSGVSLLLPSKLRKRVHFVKGKKDIPINSDSFLMEHGGKREHDAKEWVQRQIKNESDSNTSSLSTIRISL